MSIDGKWIKKNETREFEENIIDDNLQEQFYDDKKTRFNEMVENGMNRVMAYQIAYNISAEDAKEIVLRENYNNLISCGIPEEVARQIVYKSVENNAKKR